MQSIVVHVGWCENYGAACSLVPGCIATHRSLEGVKAGFASALAMHLDAMQRYGLPVPEALCTAYELRFELDTLALLKHLEGYLGLDTLVRITGMRRPQIRQYLSGQRQPRAVQRTRIVSGLQQLASQLRAL